MINLVKLYGRWGWEIRDEVNYFELLGSSLEIRTLECLKLTVIIYKFKCNHKKTEAEYLVSKTKNKT